MKEKICSFFGHRDADSSLRSQIKTAVTDLIKNKGITIFYSGGMGNFDSLCESVVRELKKTYPLKLYLIAPYMTQKINRDGKYYKELYDDIIVPDLREVHYKRAITERNKWITEQSDIILCYPVYQSLLCISHHLHKCRAVGNVLAALSVIAVYPVIALVTEIPYALRLLSIDGQRVIALVLIAYRAALSASLVNMPESRFCICDYYTTFGSHFQYPHLTFFGLKIS